MHSYLYVWRIMLIIQKKVMGLIITIILFHVFSMFMSTSFQGGLETSAGMMMSTRR